MARRIYNKLVRDGIPEIIRGDNGDPKTRIMDNEEYQIELFKKVIEEGKELEAARGETKEVIKEIGDIYEVIDAIIESNGLDKDEIMTLKKVRREKRGGFKDKIFLEQVDE